MSLNGEENAVRITARRAVKENQGPAILKGLVALQSAALGEFHPS